MDDMADCGHLSLYIGPMFSGKTSRILDLYKKYKYCGVIPLVINYMDDNRYSDEDMLSTHDLKMIPCTRANTLSEIYDFDSNEDKHKFNDRTVILINEGQFFPDILEWVRRAIDPPYNKKVHVCGLDGDFKREVFGDILKLIPLADHVEKLTAICASCKQKPGIFSKRITSNMEQKDIGTSSYIPLCRRCFNEYKIEIEVILEI
jgi:thymidine kinase